MLSTYFDEQFAKCGIPKKEKEKVKEKVRKQEQKRSDFFYSSAQDERQSENLGSIRNDPPNADQKFRNLIFSKVRPRARACFASGNTDRS